MSIKQRVFRILREKRTILSLPTIPFQLAEPADVVILIYDIHGKLVRKIKLGELPAGVYVSKDRAAYWDGTNDKGERVASGVYFYILQAGDYTKMLKMVLAE